MSLNGGGSNRASWATPIVLCVLAAACSTQIGGPLVGAYPYASEAGVLSCRPVVEPHVTQMVMLSAMPLTPDEVSGFGGKLTVHDLKLELGPDVESARTVLIIGGDFLPPTGFLVESDPGFSRFELVDLPATYNAEMGAAAVGVIANAPEKSTANNYETPSVRMVSFEYSVGEDGDRYSFIVGDRAHWFSREELGSADYCSGYETYRDQEE